MKNEKTYKTIPEIKEGLDAFITSGINIGKKAKILKLPLTDKNDEFRYLDKMFGIHEEYLLWKNNLANFLNEEETITKKGVDIRLLYLPDKVPLDLFGTNYRGPETQDSQDFLNSIIDSINEKVQFIKDAQEKILKKDIFAKGDVPYIYIEEGNGYLKFDENGEAIKIGRPSSQPFRLLQCLMSPQVGVKKNINEVFESIRTGIKTTPGVYKSYDKGEKIELIENSAIKELQKGNKLKGRLHFKFGELKNKMWIEYTD